MRRLLVLCGVVGLLGLWPSVSVAEEYGVDARERAADRALGGMVEGSRMLPSESSFKDQRQHRPGQAVGPSLGTRAAPVSSAGAPAAAPSAPSAAPAALSAPAPVGNRGEFGPTGSSTGPTTPAGPSEGPTAPPGPTGGILEPTPTIEPGPGPEPEAPAGPTSGGDAIVNVGADLSVEGGTVDANLDAGVNTEADTLLNVDAASDVATDGPVPVEVETTESALVASELGAEEGINDAPVSGEAQSGVEADVEAVAESDESLSNPADGLTLP